MRDESQSPCSGSYSVSYRLLFKNSAAWVSGWAGSYLIYHNGQGIGFHGHGIRRSACKSITILRTENPIGFSFTHGVLTHLFLHQFSRLKDSGIFEFIGGIYFDLVLLYVTFCYVHGVAWSDIYLRDALFFYRWNPDHVVDVPDQLDRQHKCTSHGRFIIMLVTYQILQSLICWLCHDFLIWTLL